MRKSLVIHPFLFALFPVLFLYARNMQQFSLGVLVMPIIVVLAGAALLWGLASLILRSARKAAVMVSLFLLLFFWYGHAWKALPMFRFYVTGVRVEPTKTIFSIWVVVFVLGLWFVVRTRRHLRELTRIINVAAGVVVAISALNIIVYQVWSRTRPERIGAQRDTEQVQSTDTDPDIYYIIMDGYGRQDVLRELYGYDNGDFIRYLESRGLYVADKSTSNYAHTGLSLSSALNLRYTCELLPDIDEDSRDQIPLRTLIRKSEMFRFVKRRGYTTVAFSPGYEITQVTNADVYLTPGWFGDEFQNALLDMTPVWVVFKRLSFAQQHRHRVLYILDRLGDIADQWSPKFVFAHVMGPHPPFVCGPNGEPVDPTHLNDPAKARLSWRQPGVIEEYRKYYIGELIFLNKKLKEVIGRILENSARQPIIIIQGDHGSKSLLQAGQRDAAAYTERFAILNVYYLPGMDPEKLLWKDITPVNTFRVILDAYFGTDHGLVRDERCFYTSLGLPYKQKDVTDLVRPKRKPEP